MNNYDKIENIMFDRFGKDTLIALATTDGSKMYNRIVDAYYENGKFYVTSNSKSSKVRQLEEYSEVAIASVDWFTGQAYAKNLGWILDPKNSKIRTKVKKAFEAWYDSAVNEDDEDSCIIELTLTEGMLIKDHMATRFKIDFTKKDVKVSENFGDFK